MTDRLAPHGVQEFLKRLIRYRRVVGGGMGWAEDGAWVLFKDVEALLRTLPIWMCSCETPEEKAERVRERQECEAEREALPTPPKESA